MGFRLTIKGSEEIKLEETDMETVVYMTDSPDGSNAKATDYGCMLTVTGKILKEKAAETLKLGKWSLVPAEKADAYRDVVLQVVAEGQVVREIKLPNAFVVDYTEDYGHQEGIGEFKVILKQKKDFNSKVQVLGGYSAE
jgi:hypothetical protein